jgi:hypothetical protein
VLPAALLCAVAAAQNSKQLHRLKRKLKRQHRNQKAKVENALSSVLEKHISINAPLSVDGYAGLATDNGFKKSSSGHHFVSELPTNLPTEFTY